MTLRAYGVLLVALFSLFLALTFGHPIALLLALLLFFAFALCLLSVLVARATLRVQLRMKEKQVLRGAQGTLLLEVGVFAPLPLAPVVFSFLPPSGSQPYSYGVDLPYMRAAKLQERCAFMHIGTFDFGLESIALSDAFSLFKTTKRIMQRQRITVLPSVYDTPPLPVAPLDDLDSRMARARDDATSPADVRAYQQGDELKRVHWKLSLRKQQLMVRTFEVPAPPDALLLVDCAMPDGEGDVPFALRDALCEAAVSVAKAQLSAGHALRMPLSGEKHTESVASAPTDVVQLQQDLALCDFAGDSRFERVLLAETRKLRRTGAVAVITSRLTPTIVDLTQQIKRTGPCVRFLYACMDAPDEDTQRLISRLEKAAIEVTLLETNAQNP